MTRAGHLMPERSVAVSRDWLAWQATHLLIHGVRLQGTGDKLDEGSKPRLDYAARFIKGNPRATVYLGSYSGNPELTYRRERGCGLPRLKANQANRLMLCDSRTEYLNAI